LLKGLGCSQQVKIALIVTDGKAIFQKGYPFPMLAAELFAFEKFCLNEEDYYSLQF